MRLDGVDRGRLAVAVLAVLAILGGLWLAARDDATSAPMAVNGDTLGQDSDERFDDYRARAAASLDAADWEDESFGLVTFDRPLTAGQAGEVTSGLGRVNAMLVGLSTPFALPEPVEGEGRAEVYSREFTRIADSLDGVGNVPVPYQLTAVVAWDDPEAFRTLAGADHVAAVEVLPPDAIWGNFGVRPAEPPGVDMLEVAAPGISGR